VGFTKLGKKKTIFGLVEINEVQDAALSWNKGGNAGSETPLPSRPFSQDNHMIITCLGGFVPVSQ